MNEFLKEYESAKFNHSGELLEAVRKNEISHYSRPETKSEGSRSSHIRAIYERRKNHLSRYSTKHSRAIGEDVVGLLEGIKRMKEENISIWSFQAPEGISYSVFVGTDSGKVIGCIKAKDKTRVSESEWAALWGEPDASGQRR